MLTKPIRFALALLAATTAGSSAAEILDSDRGGFTVRNRVKVAAPRADVYRAAVMDIGRWWSDEHTVTGKASNLYLEAVPQGCFCERLGTGGGVVHLTVTFVNPAVMLRLTGGLGPLGLLGASGNMLWEFDDADGGGTTVRWTYAVGGYSPDGLDAIAGAVDRVLGEQLERLKSLVENGDPG
ncbi:MAG TPA: SRPBCC family protein [Woeseiaceae bacterium]|jgi:uncharacterized protein YndB with AHSA1/START domain|nr:SRPBCC family protein [Woeseiaceae bacterium]